MAKDVLDKATMGLPGGRSLDLSAIEVSIIYSSLASQRAIWVRAQRQEIPGGPVHAARQSQIDELSSLMLRFV